MSWTAHLDKGLPIGMLTSVFYLPYLPKAFRFHFNAHNIVVFGKENGNYLVSDPVMDNPTEISYEDLMRARFAKGVMPPKGKMYYPIEVPTPTEKEMKIAIVKGHQQNHFGYAHYSRSVFRSVGHTISCKESTDVG
jgi:hypothetical protein